MAGSRILDVLKKAEAVKPYAEKNGTKIVNFEDAASLTNAEMIEATPDTGNVTLNPDGSIARSKVLVAAINPDSYFDNRYKLKGKMGEREMWIVSAFEPFGYRAIKEQASGKVHAAIIPCHVVVRDKESGQLKVTKVETVSDSEFVSDFTNKLSNERMAEIQKIISEYGSDLTATDEMPI